MNSHLDQHGCQANIQLKWLMILGSEFAHDGQRHAHSSDTRDSFSLFLSLVSS